MRGYFVSIDNKSNCAFVYALDYFIDSTSVEHSVSGLWRPSMLEDKGSYVVLKSYPGYHLHINKLQNKYFEKFCQHTKVSCNGWMEIKTYSPYRVTRFKNDNMYLLLAMNLRMEPMDVYSEILEKSLRNFKIIYN
jgi:hypothetical protein